MEIVQVQVTTWCVWSECATCHR